MTQEEYLNMKREQRAEYERLSRYLPNIKEKSGIYIYTRIGEDKKNYAYVGQAVNMAQRILQHDKRHDGHIDNSIKAHGYYNDGKPNGWKIECTYYPKDMLNDMERQEIARMGETHELLNVTGGGQDEGKTYLKAPAPRKGYRQGITVGEARGLAEGEKKGYKRGYLEGVAEGRKALANAIKHIVDFHLRVEVVKDTIPHNKALAKFWKMIGEGEENGREDN